MGVMHHIADTNTVGVFKVAAVGSDSVKRTFIENENQAGKKQDEKALNTGRKRRTSTDPSHHIFTR